MVRAAQQRFTAQPPARTHRAARATRAVAAVLTPIVLAAVLAGCSASSAAPQAHPAPPISSTPAPTPSTANAASAKLFAALSSALSSAAARAAATAASAAAAARAAAASHAPRVTAPVTPAPVARPTSTVPAAVTPVHSTAEPAFESAVFAVLNDERARNGLPALQSSAALDLAARRHSTAMAASGTLAHVLPGELNVPQREAAAGYPLHAWAENVGETPDPSESGALAMQELLYSDPPHRANILSTAMHAVGVGIVVDSTGKLWITEDFGS